MKKDGKLVLIIPIAAAVLVMVFFAVSGHITKNNDLSSPTAKTTVADVDGNMETKASSTVNLLAVGNNIVDSAVIEAGKTEDSFDFTPMYSKLANTITKADIAVISQPSVFSNENHGGYPLYSTPVQMAEALSKTGFDIYASASDHILDQGTASVSAHIDTVEKNNGVAIGVNKNENNSIIYYKKNAITFAMLNYSLSSGSTSLPKESEYILNLFSKERITADIKEARKNADAVIVYAYWSNTATDEVTYFQQEYAKLFADLKVDVVIGYAPNVQSVEKIESKDKKHSTLVFYSLGNFISHQIDAQELIGGIADIKFTKTDDKVEISKAKLIPVVTYYNKDENGAYSFEVMKLKAYTKDMSESSVQSFSTPAEYQAMIEKIVSKEYLGN